jgi:hypothetical protein
MRSKSAVPPTLQVWLNSLIESRIRWRAFDVVFDTQRGREVLALADWPRGCQAPSVVMEATGDYSKRVKPEGFGYVLADAWQVKNLPGRPKRGSGGRSTG